MLLVGATAMSEFEYYEAIMMSVELSALASMNFLAIVAMYLIAAYVAGKQLPRSIAVGTSLIYTMFVIPPFVGSLGNMNRGHDLGVQAQAIFPESVVFQGTAIPLEAYLVLFGVPMLIGWMGSIYFMHSYIRNQQLRDS